MKQTDGRIFLGIILIVIGALSLLKTTGVFTQTDEIFRLTLFALVGVFCFSLFLKNKDYWWIAIPGGVFFSLAVQTLLNDLTSGWLPQFNGSIVPFGIGLAFWLIFFFDREKWWAIIPGGILLTIGIVNTAPQIWPGLQTDGFLFLGFGLTFFLINLLTKNQEKWVFYPGSILTIIGILRLTSHTQYYSTIWPLILIGVGIYLFLRSLNSSRNPNK